MLAQQGGDVGFENIAVNQPKAVVASETALQDRNQFVVDFHGEHAAGRAEQLLRQRARAGTDLQHAAVGGYAAAGDDFANHRVADEKILAVFFLLAEILLRHSLSMTVRKRASPSTAYWPWRMRGSK